MYLTIEPTTGLMNMCAALTSGITVMMVFRIVSILSSWFTATETKTYALDTCIMITVVWMTMLNDRQKG